MRERLTMVEVGTGEKPPSTVNLAPNPSTPLCRLHHGLPVWGILRASAGVFTDYDRHRGQQLCLQRV